MKNKLLYLSKMSLSKKLMTKWFLVANSIFLILIVGLINIDSIIKLFGGDFENETKILVIDNVGIYSKLDYTFDTYKKYVSDYDDVEFILYSDTYDKAVEKIKEDDGIVLLINKDDINGFKAKIVSNERIGPITNTLLSTTLTSIKSEFLLEDYNISPDVYQKINSGVEIESEILSDKNTDDDFTIASLMQILMLPIFMLVIFLVQMIGAEVNEEKTTRSMEIIISNVSPLTHFMSKVIAANVFILIQGALLFAFAIIGLFIRFILCGGTLIGEFNTEINQVVSSLSLTGVTDTLSYMIPIILIMVILTFIAYSLLAGILASMTTNMEDFQQLQTPIMIISLIGFYLSMMVSVFNGSTFIKIMSYIPFISVMLTPTLYVIGEISIFDLIGSILLLIGTIFLLIKYGLRIYKVGILNYSQTGLWKKMFKAMKTK